ncbi:MAG: HEPN domain-containing protein [Candidatus Micrarchaeota archaeon]|nr:HEPN domain-containing protein [Candidatus Micrarchaeota archaeon]
MNPAECFQKGLLRKIPVDPARVKSALDLADHYAGRAEGNLKIEFWDVAFLMAYNSMLQTGRALLFSKGVKERSHACIVAYLRKHHPALSDEIELFDTYRQNRHATQYDGLVVSENDAVQAVNDARDFLEKARRILF